MAGYVSVIKTAILLFPFLALVLSLPIFAVQYRKNESFILWRAVMIYTFIFYMLAAYCLIILPLPERSAVAALTTPKWNLTPFTFVTEFIKYAPFSLTSPGTYKATLLSPQFIQPAFNLLLTVPFGVYLRYYFKRSWWQVLLMGFGLSMFFELTQLSGLYGYYPRPYRLFDVDDLFLNTSGAMLGFVTAPLMTKFFPTESQLEAKEIKAADKVSIMRRTVAFLIDLVFFMILYSFLAGLMGNFQYANALAYCIMAIIWFVALPLIKRGGQTPGKMMVRIKIANADETKVSVGRLLLRQLQLYGIVFPFVFIWTPTWLTATGTVAQKNLEATYLVALVSVIIVGIFLLSVLLQVFAKSPRLFYEVTSKTRTIAVKKDRSHE